MRWTSSSSRNWELLIVATTVTVCTLTSAAIVYLNTSRQLESKTKKHRFKTKTMSEKVIYLNNEKACFDYIVGKDENSDEFEDLKVVTKEICPEWKEADPSSISVKIICGGITNRLFRLTWGTQSVLVRLYGDNTEAFIDRSIENMLFALLSKQGFAPAFHGRFTNGRVEGWVEARPLEPEELGLWTPINFLQLVGRELGRMHLIQVPLDPTVPVLWSKLDAFERLALEITFPSDTPQAKQLAGLNIDQVRSELAWLKSVLPSSLNHNGADLMTLEQDPIMQQAWNYANAIVFCHNDALSGNILYQQGWNRVQIIDYEYGGYNFRGFDMANHFCEHCGFEMDLRLYPSFEAQVEWFRGYMSVASPKLLAALEKNQETKAFYHALYPFVNRYALASHLFWGFWAVVQAGHSKIDFDFLDYAKKRFTTFHHHRAFFFTQ